MKNGREVLKKKQLGSSATLFPEQGATDNVGTSEPFMFKLTVAVKAEQAQTCLTPLSRRHIRFFSSTIMALKSNTLNIAYVVFTALDSPQTTFCQSYKCKPTITCNSVTVHSAHHSVVKGLHLQPVFSFWAWIHDWAHKVNVSGLPWTVNKCYIFFFSGFCTVCFKADRSVCTLCCL